jgi:hypothetical protein
MHEWAGSYNQHDSDPEVLHQTYGNHKALNDNVLIIEKTKVVKGGKCCTLTGVTLLAARRTLLLIVRLSVSA